MSRPREPSLGAPQLNPQNVMDNPRTNETFLKPLPRPDARIDCSVSCQEISLSQKCADEIPHPQTIFCKVKLIILR